VPGSDVVARGWVPFLGSLIASHLCVDLYGSFTGRRGQVLEFWPHDPDRLIVAPSLAAWLRHWVGQLEASQWRLNPDTGGFECAGKPGIAGSRPPGAQSLQQGWD
jgi:cell wall assembly regulator SMI1